MQFTQKMKIAMIFLVTVSLLLTACGGGAPAPAKQQTTWERVQAEKKLVAGLDDNYPPMGYRNEKNELIGFDIEMGAELGKRLGGIEIVWQPTAWDGVIASLQAKKFDVIISGMTITEERAKQVDFAGPYIHAAQAIAVKASNEAIKTNADLAGKIVGTQNGSAGLKVAEELNAKIGFKEIKGYSDYGLAFQDLKIGRIDAIIADNYVIAGFLANMEGEFKFTGELLAEETQGIAVRKEDRDLYEAINKALEDMILDGTMKALSEKWLGGDVTEKLAAEIQAKRSK